MAKVITITSGKGGVGKTNSSINIGIALASKGFKVCLFDADTGLANVNVLLGLKPEATLEQVLSGEKNLEEIMLEAQRGLKIIPAASGITECANLDPKKRKRLIDSLRQLEEQFDYILIDTAAGIGESVLDFVTSADYPIVVITPEPTSLTDAFSMVKMLKDRDCTKPLYALINMAKDYDNSIEVFNRFQAAVNKYLKTEVFYLGYVALDENIISSVSFQFPAIIMQADAPASLCFQKLADVMEKQFIETNEPHNFSQFWENIPVTNKESFVETTGQPVTSEPVLPTETLADSALRLLSEEETKRESAKAFLDPLIQTYIDRFQSFPIAPYQAVYQQLEMRDFPESDIRELVNTLESLFEKHHKKPLRDLDSTVIKLVADAAGSEEKLTGLNRLLKNSFKRRYNKPLNSPLEEMTEWIAEQTFTENDYSTAQKAQEKAYERRFNKPYKNEKDILIEQLRAQITELTEQKEEVCELFTELSDSISSTDELRNKLSLVLGKKELNQQEKQSPA